MVIGLTGGIGCGKTAAAACFAELGFNVVDADRLAHEVLDTPACVSRLRARWGDRCLTAEGRPDRRWIGAKVFAEPDELAFLEGLLHPEVARLRSLAVADSSRRHVVEIPLLFEKNLTTGFDLIVCVACSEETRRKRLLSKGMNSDEIERRIRSQLPMQDKVKQSDVVLWNDGTPELLCAQVRALVDRLKTA